MFKQFYSLFLFVLMGMPLLAMDRHNSYQDQMRERQEQVRRYHELQNAARNQQRAPQAPRITQEQLDAQLAIQLQQEFEREAQRGHEAHEQDRHQRERQQRLQAEARDRELARQLYEQELQAQNRQNQLQERQIRLQEERARERQIQADAELARRLQEEAGLALARQLQAEQERDYAAYMQYHQDEQSEDEESDSEEYDEEDAQNQLEQRRRELEERHQRELPRIQPAPVAPRVPAVAPRVPVAAPRVPAAAPRVPAAAPRVPAAVPQDRRLIAPCLFDQRDLMHLPGITGGALRIPGVYHVYSRAEVPERQGFSCGFHALYNMIKMERRICNRRIDDNVFIDACRRIANDPHGWSTTDESTAIARRVGLPHVHNLLYEHGRVEVFFDTGTVYEYEYGQNEEQAYQRANAHRVRQFWQNLRRTFEQTRTPMCIHFSCNIMSYSAEDRAGRGEEHAVLVTVAKMANGSTAIYIFDNVNDDENHVSQNQICAHVMHIYQQLLG